LQQKKEYDANKVNAIESLKKKKTNHVLQELKKFDQQPKVNEKSKWGWSPLYHLLKWYPLDSSLQWVGQTSV
jgi:hypothetical protein